MPENGRRWTDSTKIIWGLFGTIGFLVAVLGAVAWGMIQTNGNGIESNGDRINDVEKIVPVMQEQYKGIVKQLVRIEDKIDDKGR